MLALYLAPYTTSATVAPVAWEETFDTAESLADAHIFYRDRDGGATTEGLMIKQLEGDALRWGIRYDPALRRDSVNMMLATRCGECPHPSRGDRSI